MSLSPHNTSFKSFPPPHYKRTNLDGGWRTLSQLFWDPVDTIIPETWDATKRFLRDFLGLRAFASGDWRTGLKHAWQTLGHNPINVLRHLIQSWWWAHIIYYIAVVQLIWRAFS